MTSGVHGTSIPGIGTYFVGIDIAPGRYRCENGKGGWWVRFTGAGGTPMSERAAARSHPRRRERARTAATAGSRALFQ